MTYDSIGYAQSLKLNQIAEGHFFDKIQEYSEARTGETMLEVGCNRGALVKKMQDVGVHAYGIDVNREAIQHALAADLSEMDATSLEFPDNMFDKVFSIHTIEHIPNVSKALSEMGRVLKPGGRVVLIYPAEPGILRGLFALKSAISVYKDPLLAREIHLHSLNPKEIVRLIEGTQLEHVESHFPVMYWPQHLTVLKKRGA